MKLGTRAETLAQLETRRSEYAKLTAVRAVAHRPDHDGLLRPAPVVRHRVRLHHANASGGGGDRNLVGIVDLPLVLLTHQAAKGVGTIVQPTQRV